MSNVFERLIGAGESGAGVALDAGDVGELMALYHASFEEDAAARRPFHLNEYLTDRAFGGGEEGGDVGALGTDEAVGVLPGYGPAIQGVFQ